MGLFDSLASVASDFLGNNNAAQSAQPAQLAGPMMDALRQHGINGIGDLVQQFQQGGFAQHVQSWVGNGQNLPISADEIQQVFSQPVVAGLAQKFGVDPQQASSLLAQYLPAIVSHLTPNGEVPAQG